MIDEQHRFGVKQRQKLRAKGGAKLNPHLLSMTATPIPRTLYLSLYGDLDLSVLDELPKGRQEIIDRIVAPNERPQILAAIDLEVEKGRQVFVLCPLIDESDKFGAKAATAEYEKLRRTVFAHRRIGLLHGRLEPEEKEKAMNDFAQGKIDILVSTTVVEVGVDIPNASVMMIENAERFGLAQIWQLRGRVGRAVINPIVIYFRRQIRRKACGVCTRSLLQKRFDLAERIWNCAARARCTVRLNPVLSMICASPPCLIENYRAGENCGFCFDSKRSKSGKISLAFAKS